MSAPQQPTEQFNFVSDPRSLDARTSRLRYKSQDDVTQLGGMTEIRLPNVHNGLLDCGATTLSLTLAKGLKLTGSPTLTTVTDPIKISPLCGASAAISRITYRCGGNTICDLNNYAQIYALLRASNSPLSSFGYSSVTEGTSGGHGGGNQTGMLEGSNIASDFFADVVGTTDTVELTKDISFELSLLGMFSSVKMLPLFQINDDIVVQVYFNNNISDLFFTNSPLKISSSTMEWSNVALNAKIISISDFGCEQIRKASQLSANRPMSWSDSAYTSDFVTIPVATLNSTTTVQVVSKVGGLKPRSCTALMTTGFPATSSGDQIKYECCHAAFETQYRCGGQLFPPQPLVGCQQATGAQLCSGGQGSYTSLTNVFSKLASPMSETNCARSRVAANDQHTMRAVCGYPLANEADMRGIDLSESTIEVICRYRLPSVGAFTVATTTPIQQLTLLKYNCVYSISEGGEFTVTQ